MIKNLLKNCFNLLILFCLFNNNLFCKNLKSKKIVSKKEKNEINKPVEIKYAVFDVNGCFWRPKTKDIFNKYIENYKVSFWDKIKMGGYFVAHKLGTINVKAAYEALLSNCKGKTQEENKKSTDIIWNDICKDYIYKKSLEIFNEHRKKGVKTIIASTSPSEIYYNLLDYYKFDHLCATELEKKDGILTGKLVGNPCAGKDKRNMVKKLIENELKGSLKETVFYARSQLDIPLLKLVGKPVALNPDPNLKSYAKIKGWEIIEADECVSAGFN